MSGGGPSLYRSGGASDSTNLNVIMGFDEQQLLVQLSHRNLINRKDLFCVIIHLLMPTFYCLCFNAFNSKMFSHLSISCHTAPHLHVTSGRTRACAPHRPSGRPRPHPRPRPRPRPRPGSARRASARVRVVHRPPLTVFTSGVHEVHPLSRLRSSSNPSTIVFELVGSSDPGSEVPTSA